MFGLLGFALKGYLVLRVFMLARKGRIIDAIRLVRAEYGHMRLKYGSPMYGDPPGSLDHIRNAKDFVTQVKAREWPVTF